MVVVYYILMVFEEELQKKQAYKMQVWHGVNEVCKLTSLTQDLRFLTAVKVLTVVWYVMMLCILVG
jgi:hypothetical protein